MSCARTADLAPELALGVLTGDERAEAVRHLARCPECRALVAELGQVADSLLLLVPPADPPVGFESRAAVPPRRRSRWTWVAAAAAAATLASGVTFAVTRSGDDDRIDAARLVVASGEPVGRVWTYDGDVDWVFMTIDAPEAAGRPYRCEAVYRDGRVVALGRFTAAGDGTGSWARPVGGPVDDLVAVRMLGADGDVVATASLR